MDSMRVQSLHVPLSKLVIEGKYLGMEKYRGRANFDDLVFTICSSLFIADAIYDV
jgi:hypothetical protein